MDDINQMTLEYLMNPVQYEKYLNRLIKTETIDNTEIINNAPDIMKLTQDMLNNKYESNILQNAFEEYSRVCLLHLRTKKVINKLQEDYKHLPSIKEESQYDLASQDDFHPKIPEKESTLDSFVIKKNKKKKKKIKFPKKRIK